MWTSECYKRRGDLRSTSAIGVNVSNQLCEKFIVVFWSTEPSRIVPDYLQPEHGEQAADDAD
jgi:hypothetical protein